MMSAFVLAGDRWVGNNSLNLEDGATMRHRQDT